MSEAYDSMDKHMNKKAEEKPKPKVVDSNDREAFIAAFADFMREWDCDMVVTVDRGKVDVDMYPGSMTVEIYSDYADQAEITEENIRKLT